MSDTASPVGGAPRSAPSAPPAPEVVRRFLDHLQAGDVDRASELLAPDVRYINVSLPTIRGRDRVHRVLSRAFGRPAAGFEVYIRRISADGEGTVLTERVDVLIYGPVRVQIWVCGRFDVDDGRIVMWKDYFDWMNVVMATARGLLGAAVPALRPGPPV